LAVPRSVLDIAIDSPRSRRCSKAVFPRDTRICVLSYAPTHRATPSLFPDRKNTGFAHDTSLDRYQVWRIRSFIRIDMLARAFVGLVVYFKIRFYPLEDIIVFCETTETNKEIIENIFSLSFS